MLEFIPNWKTCFGNKNATMFPLLGRRNSCVEFRYGNSLLKKMFNIVHGPLLDCFFFVNRPLLDCYHSHVK